jgi:hypothetical protein
MGKSKKRKLKENLTGKQKTRLLRSLINVSPQVIRAIAVLLGVIAIYWF